MEKYVFGIDIGGTFIKTGLIGTDGKLLDMWKFPTRLEDNGSLILDDIAGKIREVMGEKGLTAEQILGTGMGVPGPTGADGTVYECVNLGWGVFNVEQEMSARTGFPAKAVNDADAAALGEMWMGGGKGYTDMVVITLGTGVGAGIILNGRIAFGADGAAGEVGHFPMNEDETEPCSCGNYGCLEQYASASGVARMAKEYLLGHDDETVLSGKDPEEITSVDVFDAARSGDAVAQKLVDGFGKEMGKALAYIACVVDPQIFVIGGGLSNAGEIVIDAIRKHYRHYAFHACRETEFALATLGNRAGIYGAARILLDSVKNL